MILPLFILIVFADNQCYESIKQFIHDYIEIRVEGRQDGGCPCNDNYEIFYLSSEDEDNDEEDDELDIFEELFAIQEEER